MREALNQIRRLQEASGANAKTAILKENCRNDTFKRLIYYACHPRMTYKISEERLREHAEGDDFHDFKDIFEVCDTLARNKAASNLLISGVLHFLDRHPDDERELYVQIISKTLRLGVTSKTINKAIPGLFPEWEVQQAYPIEKHPLKPDIWFSLTQKLNGVRCTYYRGQMIARSGAVIEGLDHISDELNRWPDMVFDGELTLKDKADLSDNEAFRKATGIVNSDEEDKSEICFTIFDLLPAFEFDKGQSSDNYGTRRRLLDSYALALENQDDVKILPALYSGNDQNQIDVLLNQMVAEDKEGLMVNLDVPYKCKRHSGILKVKRFYTMDLPIVQVEEGAGKFANTMGAIVVDFKGNNVGVGTGFTDEQRAWFWNNRDEVVGVLAEIKYKEISSDKKTGAESLQFPVFVQLRTDKDQVSYG